MIEERGITGGVGGDFGESLREVQEWPAKKVRVVKVTSSEIEEIYASCKISDNTDKDSV